MNVTVWRCNIGEYYSAETQVPAFLTGDERLTNGNNRYFDTKHVDSSKAEAKKRNNNNYLTETSTHEQRIAGFYGYQFLVDSSAPY